MDHGISHQINTVVGNGTAVQGPGEETPLLGDLARGDGRDDRSSEPMSGEERGDGEILVNSGKANQQVGKGRGLLIIISLWGLIFLQASNMSGITTTQSKIAEDLDSFIYVSWFSSAYLIAMSSFAPLCARLAQLFSPRNSILAAAILFALGGFVTSQAPRLSIFLLGRAISGAGGAGVMTISFILVLELSGKKRRGLFLGLVNAGFTTGVALGAVVAGALLPVTGWRFLFWIQSPLALLSGIGIFFSIPKSFTAGSHGGKKGSTSVKLARIDYLGGLTLIATVVSLLYGLSSQKIVWQPILLSFFLLLLFVTTEIYVAQDPIIPVTVLKSRGVLLACVAQLGIMMARWMVLFYTPVYAIAVRGWNPASAGSILIPTNVGFAVGGLLVGWLHIKTAGSYWIASSVSYFLFACSVLLLSQISNKSTPAPLYFLSVFINGLCIGASLNYTLAHLLHQTPSSAHFISISLLGTFRGFAGSFGSAIGGGLFVRVLKSGLETGFGRNGGLEGREDLVRRLLGSPTLVKTLKGVESVVAMDSYAASVKELFLAAAGLALAMVFLQAGTGRGRGVEEKEREEQVAARDIAEDEEWEEGMEQGA